MNTEKYNGYTNYNTWLTKLWMDQDQGRDDTELIFTLFGQRAHTEDFEERIKETAGDLANHLREEYDNASYEVLPQESGVFRDMLNASLQEVNWYEIAEKIMDPLRSDLLAYKEKENAAAPPNTCASCIHWARVDRRAGRCSFVDVDKECDLNPTSSQMFQILWNIPDTANFCLQLVTGCDFFCFHWNDGKGVED